MYTLVFAILLGYLISLFARIIRTYYPTIQKAIEVGEKAEITIDSELVEKWRSL